MATRTILEGDNPRLRKISRPVGNINQRILDLLDDMAQTMYEARGVGLAAPQVGVLRRVVVIDVGEGLIELINPAVSYTHLDVYKRQIKDHAFLEYADVFGKCYGTPKEYVLGKLNQGKSVILEIDVQGAMQVVKNYPQAVTIFILPPSEEILLKRLRGRGTETDEQIEKRFGKARAEMEYAQQYGYRVVNDDLDVAVDEVRDIIDQARAQA